jgi:DNA-directed RNA polymerase sigma subunit (sigma70/sigma32)
MDPRCDPRIYLALLVPREDGNDGQPKETLRRAKSQISALDEGDLRPDQVKKIARKLGVSEQDVVDMNRQMAGDASLNSPLREESEGEWQDLACR